MHGVHTNHILAPCSTRNPYTQQSGLFHINLTPLQCLSIFMLDALHIQFYYCFCCYHHYHCHYSIIIKKCTYLSNTATQNAAGTLYTVNKVPAYNIGRDSELATSGPENSSKKKCFQFSSEGGERRCSQYGWQRLLLLLLLLLLAS